MALYSHRIVVAVYLAPADAVVLVDSPDELDVLFQLAALVDWDTSVHLVSLDELVALADFPVFAVLIPRPRKDDRAKIIQKGGRSR